MGFFELTPTFLDLQPGDHFRLNVKYTPHSPGQHTADILMVCDNCQIREVTILGNACTASVQIEAVDGVPPIFIDEQGSSTQETLDFGATGLNTVAQRVVRLLNTTPLPLQFEWRHFALPLPMLPPTALRTAEAPPLVSSALGEPVEPDTSAFPYTITPSSGLLPPGEGSEFTVSYRPESFDLSTGAALLLPLEVPPEAMPGYGTEDSEPALELGLRLLGRGHGVDLAFEPAAVLGSACTLGAVQTLTATLTNPNVAPRSFRWLDEIGAADDAALLVEVEPAEAELEAGASVELRLKLRGEAPGLLCRELRFAVAPFGNAK